MKIITVVGARPQFIKAAVVSRALRKHSFFTEILVHTGQHFDDNMSEIFFREMEINHPAYSLEVNSLSHGAMTARMLEGLESILQKEKPELVIVYGDTNSTLAGALAAKKMNIKLAHIEAGLRSYNLHMPEEVNRILTDRVSDFLYCPTEVSVNNLIAEGYKNFKTEIVLAGDVMQDAAIHYSEIAKQKSDIIKRLQLSSFVLSTIHRQENTDDVIKLHSIFEALNKINAEIPVILPLHPRTQKALKQTGFKTEAIIIDPVGYFDMLQLLQHCSLVLTDSGGLQKEAFFLHKHCVTFREQTEWTELVQNGFNELAGSQPGTIYQAYRNLISRKSDFTMDLYGNGNASEKIVEHLIKKFDR